MNPFGRWDDKKTDYFSLMAPQKLMTLGSDKLLSSDRLNGRSVGVVCNAASVDSELHHIVDRVAANPDLTLTALFGPQHGFHSVEQDNMIETAHAKHPIYGIPVYSLYGDTREPTAQMLQGLDVLIIDLQDVGTRVYTYAYTLANCLRAASRHGVAVVVCDRPNPIGGLVIEGPTLETGLQSFVGQFPIPLRHAMTIGELAHLFNTHYGIGAELDVIPMSGWTRDGYYEDTGLTWVMPSPNLPTIDSAVVYPGCVLFEGTNVSEGRGTTRPFELIGAPWIHAKKLVDTLNALQLSGVAFRPIQFQPTFQKHAGQVCSGCQIHVTDRNIFQSIKVSVALLQALRQQNSDLFEWRKPPYEYEHVKLPIDILVGRSGFREQVEGNLSAHTIVESWASSLEEFKHVRRQFLLYE